MVDLPFQIHSCLVIPSWRCQETYRTMYHAQVGGFRVYIFYLVIVVIFVIHDDRELIMWCTGIQINNTAIDIFVHSHGLLLPVAINILISRTGNLGRGHEPR